MCFLTYVEEAMKKVGGNGCRYRKMTWTDLFGVRITPENGVAVPVVCYAYRKSFALRWHQSSDKASMYISHHHITAVGENKLWQSSWKSQRVLLILDI